MKRRTHNLVIAGYILLGLAVLLLVPFWPMRPEPNGLWGLEYPLYFLLMLFFFVGLVLIVGGTTNEEIPLKRTFESIMRRFKQ
jgi:hypothetical protein